MLPASQSVTAGTARCATCGSPSAIRTVVFARKARIRSRRACRQYFEEAVRRRHWHAHSLLCLTDHNGRRRAGSPYQASHCSVCIHACIDSHGIAWHRLFAIRLCWSPLPSADPPTNTSNLESPRPMHCIRQHCCRRPVLPQAVATVEDGAVDGLGSGGSGGCAVAITPGDVHPGMAFNVSQLTLHDCSHPYRSS